MTKDPTALNKRQRELVARANKAQAEIDDLAKKAAKARERRDEAVIRLLQSGVRPYLAARHTNVRQNQVDRLWAAMRRAGDC